MDMMVVGFRNNSKVGGNGLTPTEEEAHFGFMVYHELSVTHRMRLGKMPDSSLELLKKKGINRTQPRSFGITGIRSTT